MNTGDTIAAISSAVGSAARMIVRISGPDAPRIVEQLAGASASPGARHGWLRFADADVPAWVYFFTAPRSFTAEHVAEFHIPGNPLLARMLLDELARLGCRQAEPGEFTARAYFNGRIDLSEAEGVAATIAAHSDAQLAAARQLLAGELARRLRPITDDLTDTLALIEAGIDFADQDIEFLSIDQVRDRIDRADRALDSLLRQSSRFEKLWHEPRIALVGRPNAGKSTLLNALAGHERAIVSPQAGTTRDAIWAHVQLAHGLVQVIDVAGMEHEAEDDPIARRMQSQAHRALQEADIVVQVHDCTDQRPPLKLPRQPHLRVITKIDLGSAAACRVCFSTPCEPGGVLKHTLQLQPVSVSVLTGDGMDELRRRLDELAFERVQTGATLALNARHVQEVEEARAALARALQQFAAGAEVIALELREALDALGRILGAVMPEDVLGRIFSTFCIGK